MKLDQRGVTLIELLAAITLLLLVLIPFTTLFTQGFKTDVENNQLLDSKIIATSIIEELKVGIRESASTVDIGGEVFDISNPDYINIEDYPIILNGSEFILSFSIYNYELPDEMITGVVASKPDNLYHISVNLRTTNEELNVEPVSLSTVVKR